MTAATEMEVISKEPATLILRPSYGNYGDWIARTTINTKLIIVRKLTVQEATRNCLEYICFYKSLWILCIL